MKKIKFVFLLVTLVVSSIFVSCSKSSSVTETPIILRYTVAIPPQGPNFELLQATAKKIEDRTEGEVKIELYPFGTLVQPREMLEAVQKGLADVAEWYPAYQPGLFPKLEFVELPVVCQNSNAGNIAINELLSNYLAEEWEANGVKLVALRVTSMPAQVFSIKPLRSASDFKGVKISSSTPSQTKGLQLIGFAATSMPGGEVFTSLQRGTIEAALRDANSVRMSKLEEVVKYSTKVDFGVGTVGLMMNPTVYKDLPNNIRNILTDELVSYFQKSSELMNSIDTDAWTYFKSKGIEVITLPSTEIDSIRKTLAPMQDEWMVTQEKAGVKDAKEFATQFLKLHEKYLAE